MAIRLLAERVKQLLCGSNSATWQGNPACAGGGRSQGTHAFTFARSAKSAVGRTGGPV